MSHLSGRRHPQPNDDNNGNGSSLEQSEAELGAIRTGKPLEHDMIIEQARKLKPWQQRKVYDALKLMVEKSATGQVSTNKNTAPGDGGHPDAVNNNTPPIRQEFLRC